jgi:hypothetical protein
MPKPKRPIRNNRVQGQQEARALETLQFMPKHIITAMPLTVPTSHTVPVSARLPAALAYGSYLDLLLACRTQEALPALVQVSSRQEGHGRGPWMAVRRASGIHGFCALHIARSTVRVPTHIPLG